MSSPYVQFLKHIRSIDETDYGDFMRKANLYLNELKEEPSAAENPVIAERIEAMQKYIQYHPNWDIPTTREQIEMDTENLIFLESLYAN